MHLARPRYTDGEGGVEQRNKLQHGLIERPRLTSSAAHGSKEFAAGTNVSLSVT